MSCGVALETAYINKSRSALLLRSENEVVQPRIQLNVSGEHGLHFELVAVTRRSKTVQTSECSTGICLQARSRIGQPQEHACDVRRDRLLSCRRTSWRTCPLPDPLLSAQAARTLFRRRVHCLRRADMVGPRRSPREHGQQPQTQGGLKQQLRRQLAVHSLRQSRRHSRRRT